MNLSARILVLEEVRMKKVMIFSIMLLLPAAALASPLDDCSAQIKYGAPSYGGVLLCRKGYVLSYNTAHKTADWVAYHLTREKMHGNIPRTNDFRPDPDLASDQQAELADYSHSGYTRGQMTPATSMRWSARAMSESFLLTNVAPQKKGMNKGIWKFLEQKVRDWVNSRGELYIVTGSIYKNRHPDSIGSDHVAVPDAFYKVVFDPVRVDAIAFIIPNRKEKSSDLPRFITSVDKVEKETGFDFLSNLDDDVESLIEARVDPFWIR